MNMRKFARCLALIATFVMSCFVAALGVATASAAAPDSLVGKRYAFTESGGTSLMLLQQNNRYEFVRTNSVIETGYFTATRTGADTWNVAETTSDGTLTTQYAFTFTSPTAGTVTTTVAGTPRRTFAFQETTDAGSVSPESLNGKVFSLNGVGTISFGAGTGYTLNVGESVQAGTFNGRRIGNVWIVSLGNGGTSQLVLNFSAGGTGGFSFARTGQPIVTGSFAINLTPARLVSMNVQNEISQTGPSFYRINFTPAGQFTIDLPGYGTGTFVYTPGMNTAHLVLNYTGDLAGDVDDLNLTFNGPSGSTIPSLQSGAQTISGEVYPVQGTFTFTGGDQ